MAKTRSSKTRKKTGVYCVRVGFKADARCVKVSGARGKVKFVKSSVCLKKNAKPCVKASDATHGKRSKVRRATRKAAPKSVGLKCIRLKLRGGKTRKQCARKLAGGRLRFVKNSTPGCPC